MPFGTSKSNWIIYQEQFWGGVTEVQHQNIDAFNAASNGCIQLVTMLKKGEFEQEAFLKKIAGLVTSRDISSTALAADIPLSAAEYVQVKVNRKIGPVGETIDAWKKLGEDPQTMSYLLGQQIAPDILADFLNSALRSVRASITSVTGNNYDGTAGNMSFNSLVQGLSTMGDAQQQIVCLVMHSKPFFDLVSDGLANYKIDTVAGAMIQGGFLVGSSPITMGRPIIVTDSAALLTAGTPNVYHTLGLVAGAVTVTESEERTMESQMVLGNENIVMRVQGEYAFNVGTKGMQWSITLGGNNPSDTNLALNTNWVQVATDHKATPGVRIYTH
jgi:hypothetical protein